MKIISYQERETKAANEFSFKIEKIATADNIADILKSGRDKLSSLLWDADGELRDYYGVTVPTYALLDYLVLEHEGEHIVTIAGIHWRKMKIEPAGPNFGRADVRLTMTGAAILGPDQIEALQQCVQRHLVLVDTWQEQQQLLPLGEQEPRATVRINGGPEVDLARVAKALRKKQ